MQFLLIEEDPIVRDHWIARLRTSGVKTITVSGFENAKRVGSQTRFAMAIVGKLDPISVANNNAVEFLQFVRSRSVWTLRLIELGDEAAERQAYLAGFDDCISPQCSNEAIQAKLCHAKHLQKLEVRLAQAQKLESIGELAAGIAHEINTPIQYVGDNTRFVKQACEGLNEVFDCCNNLIAGYDAGVDVAVLTNQLRMTMRAIDVDYLIDEIPMAINQTLEGVDRVANIVRAMKEFAHPGSTEMTLTDLANSIKNTVMVARNEWKYVAEMETVFDPNLPLVRCLPGELNQVLLNMIVNASHAIAESLGESPIAKGTITMKTRLAPPYAEIRISDTGHGIDPENIDRIFSPFFTTKAAGKGTGQGLAIAHNVIVEKHGGSIQVESEVGRGTTFIIRIPLESRRSTSNADPDLTIRPIETQV